MFSLKMFLNLLKNMESGLLKRFCYNLLINFNGARKTKKV